MTLSEHSSAWSTLAGPGHASIEVKGSRFIARADRADRPEHALDLVRSWSDPRATHNCWAYRIGGHARCSDDGEPPGTAGKPLLRAIERLRLDHVVVLVTRYFGGTKLGASGLSRAYALVATTCLAGAGRIPWEEATEATVYVPYGRVPAVLRILRDTGLTVMGRSSVEDVMAIHLQGSTSQIRALEARLQGSPGVRLVTSPPEGGARPGRGGW